MNFEIKQISINDLHVNQGQIDGVPRNPRLIKDDRFKKLVKSLQDAPEMLHLREVIAYDNGGELVVAEETRERKRTEKAQYNKSLTQLIELSDREKDIISKLK